jgi:hypothetical protein
VAVAVGCYVGYAAWLSGTRVADYVLGSCRSLMLDVLSKGKAYTHLAKRRLQIPEGVGLGQPESKTTQSTAAPALEKPPAPSVLVPAQPSSSRWFRRPALPPPGAVLQILVLPDAILALLGTAKLGAALLPLPPKLVARGPIPHQCPNPSFLPLSHYCAADAFPGAEDTYQYLPADALDEDSHLLLWGKRRRVSCLVRRMSC